MRLMTLEQLQATANAYINQATKLSHAGFTATKEDITGLVNKIFAEVFLDGDFSEDLGFMDGFKVEVGNTIEEYYAGFVSPEDYDESGAGDDAPARPDWAVPFYSDRLGRKKFKTTKDYGTIEKAFSDAAEYGKLVMSIVKRLYDSLTLYLNQCKRELIGAVCAKHESVESDAAYNPSTKYKKGDRFQNGVVIKDYDAGKALDTAVATGYAVKLDLVTKIAKPTDSATGEAFIESVKVFAEKFKKPQQGYSYNGNIAGKGPKYVLILKDGILPDLEVQTMAGAFQKDMLAFPVEVRTVKDFGSKAGENAFAILTDERSMKLHNAYRAVRTRENADGDFINYVLHDDEIAYWSPNVMTHVWVEQA